MEDFFVLICGFILIVIMVILLVFGIYGGFNLVDFYLDKSMCKAYVNNQLVYDGRCHFINVDSIGENGNTKSLTIYKDKMCFKPKAKYIHENIKIKN